MANATPPENRPHSRYTSLLRQLNTPNACTGIAVFTAAVFLITAAKGLRPQGGYPLIHWFFDYSAGFIKRGLIGTIVKPLFAFKNTPDMRACVTAISYFMFFLTVTFITLSIRSLLLTRIKKEGRHCPVTLISLLVFATAPAAVMAGNTMTFFDIFLAVYCMLSLFAIQAGRLLLPAILSVIGIATHEIYFLYGFPVVLLGLGNALFYGTEKTTRRRTAMVLGVNLLLPLSVFLAIGLTQATTNHLTIQVLAKNLASYQLFDDLAIQQGLFPISHSAIHYLLHPPQFSEHLGDMKIVQSTYVTTLFLIVVLLTLLMRRGQRLLAAATPFVVIAPLFLAFIAWDTHRFAALTTMQAFFVLVALKEKLTSGHKVTTIILLLLSGGVLVNNLAQDVWFFNNRVNENGVTALRSAPPINVFRHCNPLFTNANFEAGKPDHWTVEGDAFIFELAQNDAKRDALIREQLGPSGHWWISSEGLKQRPGTSPTGTMTSESFVIRQDRIMFMVKGPESLSNLYVTLEVNGTPILKVTGDSPDRFQTHLFDVSRFRGQNGIIRIVDANPAPGAHIAVDGLCFSPLVKGGTPTR